MTAKDNSVIFYKVEKSKFDKGLDGLLWEVSSYQEDYKSAIDSAWTLINSGNGARITSIEFKNYSKKEENKVWEDGICL